MRFRFAFPLAVAILVSTAACNEWAARPLSPGPRPSRIVGKPVRVTRVGGEVLHLQEAEIRGDSLYGTRLYFTRDPYVTLPLSEVARLEVRQPNYTGPVLFGLVSLAVIWRYVLLPAVYD